MIVTKVIAQAVRVHGGPGGGGGASSASLMEKYFSQVSAIFYQQYSISNIISNILSAIFFQQYSITNILSSFPVYFLPLILNTLPSDVVTSVMQLIMIYKLMRMNCNL